MFLKSKITLINKHIYHWEITCLYSSSAVEINHRDVIIYMLNTIVFLFEPTEQIFYEKCRKVICILFYV